VFVCPYCIFLLIKYSVFLQYFDTVGWVFWPVKTVARITYTLLVETLNHAQSINQRLYFEETKVSVHSFGADPPVTQSAGHASVHWYSSPSRRVCSPELTMGHILWPATHDPVPDHDMSRSRLLTYIMSSRLLFSAMMCNLEFWMWLRPMQCIFFYTVGLSLVVCTIGLHRPTAIFTSWTRWKGSLFFNLTSYTFTFHLIMGQVFMALTRDHRDPITFCWPTEPLSALQSTHLWWCCNVRYNSLLLSTRIWPRSSTV